MPEPAAETDSLSVELGGETVLDGVDFTLERGEFAAVIGPSGGGKTTLFKALLGLLTPSSGEVQVLGEDPKRARARVGYSPQQIEARTDFPVTVEEVVCMGSLKGGALFQRVTEEQREAARELLAELEIAELAEREFGRVSGGEAQRVMVARAMMGEPELLLLDEVASEVDVGTQHVIFDYLKELNAAGGTVLVSSHDLNCVAGRIPRSVALNRRVLADGPTAEVLSPELVEEVFQTHYLFAPTAREEIEHE